MTTQTFKVTGLHCEGCVKSVRAILEAQPGVSAAKIDLETGRAEIDAAREFDLGRAIAAMSKAGFSLSPG